MKPASYRDIQPEEIPGDPGGSVKVIAGTLDGGAAAVPGRSRACPPRRCSSTCGWMPARFTSGRRRPHRLPVPLRGQPVGGRRGRTLPARQAGVLSDGERIEVEGRPRRRGVLLLAARPLGEPVVQYGPFVMNTREEIEQALDDYRTAPWPEHRRTNPERRHARVPWGSNKEHTMAGFENYAQDTHDIELEIERKGVALGIDWTNEDAVRASPGRRWILPAPPRRTRARREPPRLRPPRQAGALRPRRADAAHDAGERIRRRLREPRRRRLEGLRPRPVGREEPPSP
jgi:hypothetical protein